MISWMVLTITIWFPSFNKVLDDVERVSDALYSNSSSTYTFAPLNNLNNWRFFFFLVVTVWLFIHWTSSFPENLSHGAASSLVSLLAVVATMFPQNAGLYRWLLSAESKQSLGTRKGASSSGRNGTRSREQVGHIKRLRAKDDCQGLEGACR